MHFIANRKKFYFLSGFLFVLSCFVFIFVKPNLGIDMTGGLQIEYVSSAPFSQSQLDDVRSDIIKNYVFEGKKVINDVLLYSVNGNSLRTDIGLSVENDVTVSNSRANDIRKNIPEFFKKTWITVTEASFVSVGQSFGQFVIDRAYLTLIVCFVAIALYLMYAFRSSIEGTSSFTFGLITLITLSHDVIVAAGIFILLGIVFPILKVDTFFVTAVLTTLGYSISDTIVILDRIRANYREKKSNDKRSDKQIFDDSINVSLRRSIYTSMAIVMVLVAMLFFGPEALLGFVTLMLLGAVVGTYSSICVAAPMVYDINSWKRK